MTIKRTIRTAALLLALLLAVTACTVGPPVPSGSTGTETAPSGQETPDASVPERTQASSEAESSSEEETAESTEAPLGPPYYTLRIVTEPFFGDLNPFSEGSGEREFLLGLLSEPLYRLTLRGEHAGLSEGLAAGDPIDVTGEQAGRFGLAETAEKQAWVIPLKEGLLWEDGTPLTAYDLEASAARLLDPASRYDRGDIFYRGALEAVGAERYHIAGTRVLLENVLYASYTEDDLTAGEDGVYRTPEGGTVYLAISFRLNGWLQGHSLKEYMIYYGEEYFSDEHWEEILAAENRDGLIPLTDETRQWVLSVVTGNPRWGDSEEDLPQYFVYETAYPRVSWDAVGIKALSDTELLIVTERPIGATELKLALSENFLVDPAIYDAATVGGSSVYGTSAETVVSCGLFRLDSWEAGVGMVLKRNENYYGSADGSGRGMTDEITVRFAETAAERMELYQTGEADLLGMDARMAETVRDESLLSAVPGTVNYFLAFDPDGEALEERQTQLGDNINKTILLLPAFRRALGLAVDREVFCAVSAAGSSPAYALIPDSSFADPETGLLYRDTEEGREAMRQYWGTADAAGLPLFAYDPVKAAALMEQAYQEAVREGLLDGDDLVLLTIGIPAEGGEFYEAGYEYLTDAFTAAAQNTSLAGRLFFEREELPGASFETALRDRQVDILFGVGFEGPSADPWALLEVYTSPRYQYDPSWDTSAEELTVTLSETAYTASVRTWAEIARGETRTVRAGEETVELRLDDTETAGRLTLLAALETAVLQRCDLIPLMTAGSLFLRSSRIRGAGNGFGSVEELVFELSDEEWERKIAREGRQTP